MAHYQTSFFCSDEKGEPSEMICTSRVSHDPTSRWPITFEISEKHTNSTVLYFMENRDQLERFSDQFDAAIESALIEMDRPNLVEVKK